jgi:hypothetical protein
VRVDAIHNAEWVLNVGCSGIVAIGSRSVDSMRPVSDAIAKWIGEHPDHAVREIVVDFTKVDYQWGDAPVTCLLPFIRQGVERIRFLASTSSAPALESLFACTALPWFSLERVPAHDVAADDEGPEHRATRQAAGVEAMPFTPDRDVPIRRPRSRGPLMLGLLSIAIAMFAIGCCALPFVSPGLCGMIAGLVSAFGGGLAIAGLIRHRSAASRTTLVISLVLNLLVLLLGLAVSGSNTHVIDQLEKSAPLVLGLICVAPFAALVLALGMLVWGTFSRK